MNKSEIIIRLEQPDDYFEVENLTREAFWNVYVPGCSEHYFVHVMRKHRDFIPELAFVAEFQNKIIGNIMYTKSILVDSQRNEKNIVSFGPVSVHPKFQRMGIGKYLIEFSANKAKEMGFEAIVNFGNPGNYVSSGFKSCKKFNICLEGDIFPTPLLVKELVENSFDGRRWYFRESNASEPCNNKEAVDEFDLQFSPKEKKWQPTQEEFYIYSHSKIE